MRDWFIKQETELFRMRFKIAAQKGSIQKFLHHNNIFLEQIDSEEKKRMHMDLSAAHSMPPDNVQTADFYRVNQVY